MEKGNRIKHRIALLLYSDRNLSTFPSVCNTATLLIQAGYDVDLFLPESIEADCDIEQLRILRFKPCKGAAKSIFRTLAAKVSEYALLIPFTQTGLIVSAILSKVFRIPCIYFCLEISADDEIKTVKAWIIKYVVSALNRRIDFTIVQDESRKTLIQKVHGLEPERVYCVPNSYIGVVRKKSRYLRDKFSIPNDRVIVLFTGGIEEWAIDDNLIKAASSWNSNLVLVLHGWSRDGYIEKIQNMVKDINKIQMKVCLSLDCLSTDDYMNLVSSADIGLAWYKKGLTINVQEIGLSSGKFAAFLRCGLPVIVPSYLSDLKKLITLYSVGLAADSEYEIGKCAEHIMENRQVFSDNAYQFYFEHLDFEKGFLHIIDKIGARLN